MRSQGTTANARAMKPTRVEAQGKVRWSYMIYGSRGSDGDVDVDEPAGEWRERRKTARKVDRAQRQEETEKNRKTQKRISLLPSRIKNHRDEYRSHSRKRGNTPRGCSSRGTGRLGPRTVGHIVCCISSASIRQPKGDWNVSQVVLSEREERGTQGGGGLPSTCRKRLLGNYRWPSRSCLSCR